jgi:hypothetical protein
LQNRDSTAAINAASESFELLATLANLPAEPQPPVCTKRKRLVAGKRLDPGFQATTINTQVIRAVLILTTLDIERRLLPQSDGVFPWYKRKKVSGIMALERRRRPVLEIGFQR